MQQKYKDMTKLFEHYEQFPYKCSKGKLTIGYGRNIQDRGITREEAEYLFNNDFEIAEKECTKLLGEYGMLPSQLTEGRLYVVTDMMYNMGYDRTRGFKKMLTALSKDDYDTAANEMLDSKWYKEVGGRSKILVKMMRDGK